MSETDSFIEEVSEEVRRDKLFGFFRKYAWAIGLVIAVIVGGAAYNEYSKAQKRAAFEARGNALLSVLQETDPQTRLTRLAEIEQGGDASHLTRLFRAQSALEAGNRDEAAALFDILAEDESAAEIYRDMAVLKSVYLTREESATSEQIARLDPLTSGGRPFRLLALEARAVAHMNARETESALADLNSILLDPETQQGLAQRAQQLVLLMGGELPELPGLAGATGTDE